MAKKKPNPKVDRLLMRLTRAEREAIDREAAARGVTVTDLVRAALAAMCRDWPKNRH